jgi:hypothetical protein
MGKKDKRPQKVEATAKKMSIDTILAQLSSMKDNSKSFIDGSDPEVDAIWSADVAAMEKG